MYRHKLGTQTQPKIDKCHLSLSKNGNYDFKYKIAHNLGDPITDFDAVNLKTLNNSLVKHSQTDDYHVQNKQILQSMADDITRTHNLHINDYNQLVIRVNQENSQMFNDIQRLYLMVDGLQDDITQLHSRRQPPVE